MPFFVRGGCCFLPFYLAPHFALPCQANSKRVTQMMKRAILVFVALCVTAVVMGDRAYAQFGRTEWVYIIAVPSSVLDDNVFVIRENEDAWLFELGIGCRSLWRYNGKWAIVEYSGLFGGVSNTFHLPDAQQSCRVWDATQFDLSPALLGYSQGLRRPR